MRSCGSTSPITPVLARNTSLAGQPSSAAAACGGGLRRLAPARAGEHVGVAGVHHHAAGLARRQRGAAPIHRRARAQVAGEHAGDRRARRQLDHHQVGAALVADARRRRAEPHARERRQRRQRHRKRRDGSLPRLARRGGCCPAPAAGPCVGRRVGFGAAAAVSGVIGVPSMLNFCDREPDARLVQACRTPSWMICWRISSRACSNGGGGAVRRSSHLDDVPAELRLDRRLRRLAGLQREGGGGEFRHHVGLLEAAEVAAVLRRRVRAVRLGQRREVAALVQLAMISFASASLSTRMWRAWTSSSPGLLAIVGVVARVQGGIGHRRRRCRG